MAFNFLSSSYDLINENPFGPAAPAVEANLDDDGAALPAVEAASEDDDG